MPPTQKTIRILKEIKTSLRAHFGDEIVEVILFGSRASGTAGNESDYDLLILLKSPYDWQKKREIRGVLYDIELEKEVLFDTHFLARHELNTLRGRQPIYDNALTEGIYA